MVEFGASVALEVVTIMVQWCPMIGWGSRDQEGPEAEEIWFPDMVSRKMAPWALRLCTAYYHTVEDLITCPRIPKIQPQQCNPMPTPTITCIRTIISHHLHRVHMVISTISIMPSINSRSTSDIINIRISRHSINRRRRSTASLRRQLVSREKRRSLGHWFKGVRESEAFDFEIQRGRSSRIKF